MASEAHWQVCLTRIQCIDWNAQGRSAICTRYMSQRNVATLSLFKIMQAVHHVRSGPLQDDIVHC